MSSMTTRIAVAAVLGALSRPAFAGGEDPAARQDCSVCDDPTWPALLDPMPAIAIPAAPDTATAVAQLDPTWPELRDLAPAIVLGPDGGGEPAVVQLDPTWPRTSSFAPPLEVARHPPERRVAGR